MAKINFVAPRSVGPANNKGIEISARDLGLSLGIPDKYEEPYIPQAKFGGIIPVSKLLVENRQA